MLQLTKRGVIGLTARPAGDTIVGDVFAGGSVGLFSGVLGAIQSLSDLVECTYSGYSRLAFDWSTWREYPSGRIGKTGTIEFQGQDGSPTSINVVKGMFLVDSTGALVMFDQFPAEQQPSMGGVQSLLALIVQYGLVKTVDVGATVQG